MKKKKKKNKEKKKNSRTVLTFSKSIMVERERHLENICSRYKVVGEVAPIDTK